MYFILQRVLLGAIWYIHIIATIFVRLTQNRNCTLVKPNRQRCSMYTHLLAFLTQTKSAWYWKWNWRIFCQSSVFDLFVSAQECGKLVSLDPINRGLLLSSLTSNVLAQDGFSNASVSDWVYSSKVLSKMFAPTVCLYQPCFLLVW